MNDYRPRVYLTWLILLILPSVAVGQARDETSSESVQTPTATAKKSAAPYPFEEQPEIANFIVEATNELRAEQERSTVSSQAALTAAAQKFANFMAREYKYGHTADGNRPSERAKAQGYDFCLVSENIAYVYRGQSFTAAEAADKLVTGWKNSPDHYKNMMDPDVTETGVAVSRNSTTGYYLAVQMFGRPKSLAIEFTVENKTSAAVQYQSGSQTLTLPPHYRRTHQVCRPTELKFFAGGTTDDEQAKIIDQKKAETGALFVISGKPGALQVSQQ